MPRRLAPLLVALGCSDARVGELQTLAPATGAARANAAEIEATPPVSKPQLSTKELSSAVYDRPRWDGLHVGWIRAGARVARSAEPVSVGPTCAWYAVEPEGFVCAGANGVTLDLDDPAVVAAAAYPPKLDDPLPYAYGTSVGSPLYSRIPTPAEQATSEGDLDRHWAGVLYDRKKPDASKRFWRDAMPIDRVPAFLENPSTARAVYGAYAFYLTNLAFVAAFDARGPGGATRTFYVTTEMFVVPQDRIWAARPSDFHGVELEGEERLPIVWARVAAATVYRVEGTAAVPTDEKLALQTHAAIEADERLLSGERYYVFAGGRSAVRVADVTRVNAVRSLPEGVGENEVWIDVRVAKQSLVLYEGRTPRFATLVSTGAGGIEHETPIGTFRIYQKHITARMSQPQRPDEHGYRYDDVPYVQYIHEGVGLHAAFWHSSFGHPASHGCINLSPRDARAVFARTLPRVPDGWHGVYAGRGANAPGTVVVVRY